MVYNNYRFSVPVEKQVRVIMDTDIKNEADDHFAVVHGLLSPKLDHVGVIAAHFGSRVSDGMERSYEELHRIFDLMGFFEKELIVKGAALPLPDKQTPFDSPGAGLIIKEAMKQDNRPLYLLFLGPLTDIASAYLMEPKIADRLTVIWIGGGRYPYGGPEFNLGNDVHAANVVFGSGMPLWQVPKNVYEKMAVSLAELEYRVYPQGRTGEYLFEQLVEHSQEEIPRKSPFRTGETWVLGDSPAVGLLLYEHRFEFDWIQAPLIGCDMNYIPTGMNRPIRVYKNIDSRLLLEDFYAKLALFEKNRKDL